MKCKKCPTLPEVTLFNHYLPLCVKAEIQELTVCIRVNGEKFLSPSMTLTLNGQCPMSNSSEPFSYTTSSSSFKLNDILLF